jgi:glutamyl-Q tRNA(Asp) synthetase
LSEADRAARIGAGRPYAIRLDVQAGLSLTSPLSWHDREAGIIPVTLEDDAVIARKDTPTSYHLAVTVDDHLQGVTLATRGVDLFAATHVHRLLQGLLGYTTPDYHHHPLRLNEAGARYSKRDGALAIRTLREQGMSAGEVRATA